MKKLISIILFFHFFSALKSQCPEINGNDLFTVDQIFRVKDISYGKESEEQRQMLDLYIPAPLEDCRDAKLIVIIHGGSFEGGSKNQIKGWGYYFAKKGFYVALVNYRLNTSHQQKDFELMLNNFLFVGDKRCSRLNSINFQEGIYRIDKSWYYAIQDARAASSYVQYHLEERGKEISKLYVIGESAGGLTALGMTLGQQAEFNRFNPELLKRYGDIDSRITQRPKVNKAVDAVVSISAGLFNASTFLSEEDSLPVIFFHGGNDRVIPVCEDECNGLERRVNGPLRLKELVDSNNLPIKMEMHLWAGEGHHLVNKYEELSEEIMDHFKDDSGLERIEEKINLYPPDALLYNCTVVAIKNDLSGAIKFMSENYENNSILVYPNPNQGTFSISMPKLVKVKLSIEMYDALGRRVFQEFMTPAAKEVSIKAGYLSPGMYELLIRPEGQDAEKVRVVIN